MLYTERTRLAMQVAYEAHQGQFDKGGVPYVFHPYEVAQGVGDDEYAICTALLHDVMEDTALTEEDLRKYGFPEEVLEALCLLTRRPDTDYMDYIRTLSKNPLAVKVKLSDLRHNSMLSRFCTLKERDFERLEKYSEARMYLEQVK